MTPTDPLAAFGRIGPTTPLFAIGDHFSAPVVATGFELVRLPSDPSNPLLRLHGPDGATGYAIGNSRHENLLGILAHLVAPAFLGQDLRRIEHLVDEVYLHHRNYKYGGMPFFTCLGLFEHAALDLLGRLAGQPVHALCGPRLRDTVPFYLTRLTRETSPEEEAAVVAEQLQAIGARAAKIKIGGRMSLNQDAAPGRTERLIPLLREAVGPDITLYADANGSYDAPAAVSIGRLLEAHGYAWLEEPCPWQDFEATREVADALAIPVAGGEQDSSLPQFAWMIRHRGVDVIQPDLLYCGGFIRACRVAAMAAAAGLPVVPHSPGHGFRNAPLLHFAALTPNLGPFVEYGFSADARDGCLRIPDTPGWDDLPPTFADPDAKVLL
ncbi:MAG: mandelate racemase/muconate lactonizing enzyme family protein [Puniceicoccaceae bacterium]|nr:MAG: mandelate racemase/muconate lactonizing enzyme family protein [Puniceicoccaceae bacterium]